MSSLPDETVIDVHTDLANSSVPDFVKLLDFLLQQAKAKALDTDTHEGSILEQDKNILSKAFDAYYSLCTVGGMSATG